MKINRGHVLSAVLPATCVAVAAWMIFDTLRTFPGEPFGDLIPGLVPFPVLMLLWGALGFVLGMEESRRIRERKIRDAINKHARLKRFIAI